MLGRERPTGATAHSRRDAAGPSPPQRGEEGPAEVPGTGGYGCQVTAQEFVKLKFDAPVLLALQLLPGSRNQYW